MTDQQSSDPSNEIAIIGMAGRFPGAATASEFWAGLRDGVESIATLSEEQLTMAGVSRAMIDHPGYVRAGAFLDQIDLFDAAFFGISPREAEIMDPQHRLFLECAWEALEDAGCNPETYQGTIGVFASALMSAYLMVNLYPHRDLLETVGHLAIRIANDRDFLATRASYKLNLKGPSICVQTACSSSLVATHLACQSLLDYQSDVVLVGGVSINVPQQTGYLYQDGGIVAPDGHCRAFDSNAQGTVFGNGLGVVVLKRLDDALSDGDFIYAVIKGSAINNDGALKVGFTAPSVDGQAEVIALALAVSGVPAETISYIEAHGTGTAIGDPVEIEALSQVFRESTHKTNFCAVGSVKTNIGHLDAAAGVAGLIKTALALHHQQIPPSLHFEKPNPQIDFASSPFYVNNRLRSWNTGATPRRAGVSSFAVGGTNAHVILEQAPAVQPSGPSRPWQLLVLSAKTDPALTRATSQLRSFLLEHPDINLADVAYSLQTRRAAFDHRRIVVCQDVADVVAALETMEPKRVLSSVQPSQQRSIAFMFPGQGAQYVNMGRDLYENEPIFRQTIDRCAILLKPLLNRDLRDVLYPAEQQVEVAAQELEQTALTQPALFVVEYGLAQLWLKWGIQPQALIGHSIGEYVAATLAGVFSLEDALTIVATRGRLMQPLLAGAMLSVALPAAEVEALLDKRLSLAAVNSPTLCVVAGPKEAIRALQTRLTADNVSCRLLHTSHAFHSSMMEPIVRVFAERVGSLRLRPPTLPFISNVTHNWITPAQATDPQYWANHLRTTVRFSEGISTLLHQSEYVLLEVGPGRTLSTFVQQHPAAASAITVTSLRHPQDRGSDVAGMLQSLGKLWLSGTMIDWAGFAGHEQRRHIPLPTYSFDRQRYWIDPPALQGQPRLEDTAAHGQNDQPPAAEAAAQLPAQHNRPQLWNPYVAPRTPLEQELAALWQDLLGIEVVGIHDNFFELGGHSLLAIQVGARIRDSFKVALPTQHLFEVSTVAELAQRIEMMRWAVQSQEGVSEDTADEREEITL